MRPFALIPLLPPLLAAPAWAEGRIAVMSAFEPEWIALQDSLEDVETQTVNGVRFVTGTLEGRDVVLFLSGISMVNAAMTTQLALDRFEIDAILFSGIAGGVDPSLSIGDVIVPAQWGNYLNVVMARETEDGFALPPWMSSDFAPFGMIHVRTEAVRREGAPEGVTRFWFDADPDLLALAETVAPAIDLPACAEDGTCLSDAPRILVGGNGVSGAAFVDNAELREWTFDTFDARLLDMESAAVAQVAFANDVPFLAIRSLSDLAGGGDGENEMGTFLALAAGNSATVLRALIAEME
jgi:adenosylhomocysteine nucleosidase